MTLTDLINTGYMFELSPEVKSYIKAINARLYSTNFFGNGEPVNTDNIRGAVYVKESIFASASIYKLSYLSESDILTKDPSNLVLSKYPDCFVDCELINNTDYTMKVANFVAVQDIMNSKLADSLKDSLVEQNTVKLKAQEFISTFPYCGILVDKTSNSYPRVPITGYYLAIVYGNYSNCSLNKFDDILGRAVMSTYSRALTLKVSQDDTRVSKFLENTGIGAHAIYRVPNIYSGGSNSKFIKSAASGILLAGYYGSDFNDLYPPFTLNIGSSLASVFNVSTLSPYEILYASKDEIDNSIIAVNPEIPFTTDPYTPIGGGDGGYGNNSTPSNVIGSFDGTPGPSIDGNLQVGASGSDIASSGMYTKYLCNNAQLNVLAQLFWEDNIGIQAVKALFGDPINSIISLVSYPFALDSLVPTKPTTFYLGKYNSLLAATAITKSSFQINWGEIEIPFFWGSFLDYAPYTKIQLYLPWGTGFVSIDPNEVMPFSANNSYTQGSFTKGKISVRTNIELDKGACVHSVIGNNGRIIGSFGGVVGKQIPMTGVDASGKVFALFGAAVSVGTTAALAAGGYPSIGKGLAYGSGMSTMNRATGREMLGEYKSAVSSALASSAALAKAPISYPRAGTFSDATNTLGYQYPYLIISRPSQSVPQQYGRFMGYPSNIFHNHLSEVKGYTEVASIHLDNIPATSSELEELESILKGGVIL